MRPALTIDEETRLETQSLGMRGHDFQAELATQEDSEATQCNFGTPHNSKPPPIQQIVDNATADTVRALTERNAATYSSHLSRGEPAPDLTDPAIREEVKSLILQHLVSVRY